MVHRKAMARPDVEGKMRYKLQSIKNRMNAVCYNKNNPKYKNYGGRGVTVCEKWHRLKGFLDDFDEIDGWNEEAFMAGRLQLDKDIKIEGNKIYSKETCMWVSPEDNVKVKPSYQRKYVGVRVDGLRKEFSNCTEFAKDYPEIKSPTEIGVVARGDKKFYNGWYFYHQGDEPNPPIVYMAKRGDETIVSFYQTVVEKQINPKAPTGVISKMKTGQNTSREFEGWCISWYTLPC